MNPQIKTLIKGITPPLLWDAVRGIAVDVKLPVTYEGAFKTFDKVRRHHPETTNYHTADSEAEEYKLAADKLAHFMSGHIPDEEDESLPRLNFLPTLLSLHGAETVSVLDVGGGLGVSFIDLMFSLPGKPVSMTVMELPETVARGRELFRDCKDISFIDAFPSPAAKFDVIYFGSSLQYFEDYRGILEQAMNLRPGLVAIADTTMGEGATFVAAQVNIANRVIPRMVFNRTELATVFSEGGYALLHKSVNPKGARNFSNYAPPISGTRHWNLVFRRSQQ
jgi:putative methyltransferase (TIGR04325 family)